MKFLLFSEESITVSSLVVQVVLIHGLTIPATTWEIIAPRLVSSGLRVLVYGGSNYTHFTTTWILSTLL